MSLSRVLSPILVGRDSDLSTLEDALLSALRGDGGVVIVGGEAGMGKTRLVNALATRARRLGCAVIAGGCAEAELSLPYLPFLEAIGNYLPSVDVMALRERLGPAAEELAQLFPQLGRPATSAGDPSQAKMRLFESMLMLLRDAASRRALLVILEDLQWADPTTRELLDYATRRVRSTNVLVVATYRTDEMHRKHALLPTIQGWRRNGQVEMIDLTALSPEQVGEMVCAIFEEQSITDEFRDFLRDRSEGNPFVLEEMLRDALDRGDIFRTETGWDRKALAEIRIPPTVRDTILQRLERLSHDDVAVLAAASVMGRSFDLASLSEVARVEESVALAALEASVTAQLIEQEDRVSGRYRFRHALTREAIYEDLVVPRRQQLHSRIADVLASRPQHVAVDLAHHLFNAGRNDEAVTMCVAAAAEAVQARAYRDSAELLERAAPFVRDPVERARMQCQAADSYWNNNESATAKRLLEQAIPDLEAAGSMVEAAQYRVLLGRCWWELLRTDRALEEFEAARRVLEPSGPSEALAYAYIRISGMATFNEEHERGVEYATKARETALLVHSDLAAAWALNFLAISAMHLGRVSDGFEDLEESYRVAVAGRHNFQIGNAVYNATWIAVHLARGRETNAWLERIALAYPVGTEPWMPYIRGLVALARGEVAEAEVQARSAIQRSRDAGHAKMVWRSETLLAHALAEQLRDAEAAEVMPPTSQRTDAQDVIYDLAPRVRLRLAAGDLAGADAEVRLVAPQFCSLASPADAVAEGANDAAWLRAFLDQVPVRGEVLESPRLAAARGRLALAEGSLADARRHLASAFDEFTSGGFLLDAWHLGSALAEAEHRSGDVAGAESRLRRVASEADGAGAKLVARIAGETATKLGLQLPSPEPPMPPAEAAQRVAVGERMVSVLFADVRGYSEIAGHSAPSDLADRIASLQRWSRVEVERRHGLVDKFAGDATMATFNVSGQSVDHAVQAVRAAVAIIDKAALAGLPVGAGVAVGPAVVGNLAGGANLSVLGEVTNLAARLQAQAAGGQVLVSEEVYRRVKDWLDTQRLAVERVDLKLKGFSGPIAAYRLTTEVPAPALG
ncbi:MAG TPA: AAA family ATPase [Candidatus Limnocylindrales bacterium]|nr:AAA family ATPase [Candidatus Limnocylindrales bacterium]